MRVQVARNSPSTKRVMRSPQHSFNLRVQPWQIRPFFIAPVLPGETMKSLQLTARVVTDPVKDKLTGWWCEYYFFYVKHTDLADRDALVAMHLAQTYDTSGLNSAASAGDFHNGGINFVRKCLDVVKTWYFRDDDEAEPTAIDGFPTAKIMVDGWWESLKKASVMPANDHELPGDNPVIPDNAPAGFATQFAHWEAMRAANLTEATFEDYLRSFGVSLPVDERSDEELQRPELIRYCRKFTYPTNTVEPTTGVPSSAAVWSVSERADKDRFFKEPGFLFGVQVIRPKVHLAAVTGTLTSYMGKAYDWLPAILQDLPFMSLKSFATGTGPAPVAFGEDYWIDLRDLFLHGENFIANPDYKPTVALPTAAGNVRYPVEADAAALFVAAGSKYVRSEGIVSPMIASSVGRDFT